MITTVDFIHNFVSPYITVSYCLGQPKWTNNLRPLTVDFTAKLLSKILNVPFWEGGHFVWKISHRLGRNPYKTHYFCETVFYSYHSLYCQKQYELTTTSHFGQLNCPFWSILYKNSRTLHVIRVTVSCGSSRRSPREKIVQLPQKQWLHSKWQFQRKWSLTFEKMYEILYITVFFWLEL